MLLGWGSDAFTEAKERNRMILTRNELIEALKAHKCIVKFTKVNGEVREMPCTLREDIVPKRPIIPEARQSERIIKENEKTLSVWCLDKNEWRSFRIDNVLELRLDLGMPIVI